MPTDAQTIATLSAQASTELLSIDADFPAKILPEKYTIHNLEEFQLLKNTFSGRFKTSRIFDFAKYSSLQNKDISICFVDPQNVSANIIFDLGNTAQPEHGRHSATLKLEKTPAYETVLSLARQQFTQRELFNFIQDWRNNLTPQDSDGKEIAFADAISRIRNVDITISAKSEHSDGDFTASKSSMAKLEAKATQGKQLPAGFTFTLTPYNSLKQRDIYLRLSINQSKQDTPTLNLRAEGLEQIKQDIIDEFEAELTNHFGDNVIKGTFSI